jgi:hypothetical protein
MSIISAKETVRFTPSDLCDEHGAPQPGAPIYLIEPPTGLTKATWTRELTNLGARHVGQDELDAALRRGIREVVAEDMRGELFALLDDFNASSQGLEEQYDTAQQIVAEHGKDSDIGKQAAENFKAIVERHGDLSDRVEYYKDEIADKYPPYSKKLGDALFFNQVAPIVSAQIFLKGGINTPVEIKPEGGRVPVEALDRIPPSHLAQITRKILALMSPSKDDAKNSDGPSSSESSRKPSAQAKKARGTSSIKK